MSINELEQKNKEVQQLTQRCHELEQKSEQHVEQFALKCNEVQQKNKRAWELTQNCHELQHAEK